MELTRAEPVPGFVVVTCTVILWMKLVSYAHCNYDFRRAPSRWPPSTQYVAPACAARRGLSIILTCTDSALNHSACTGSVCIQRVSLGCSPDGQDHACDGVWKVDVLLRVAQQRHFAPGVRVTKRLPCLCGTGP